MQRLSLIQCEYHSKEIDRLCRLLDLDKKEKGKKKTLFSLFFQLFNSLNAFKYLSFLSCQLCSTICFLSLLKENKAVTQRWMLPINMNAFMKMQKEE